MQLTIPIFNAQIYGAIETTKIASELSKLQYKKTENQIYFEVATLYFNAQLLINQLGFIENNIKNISKLLGMTKLLKAQLMAKEIEVNKVQLQFTQLSNQQESVKSKYEQVLKALKFTMGLPLTQEVLVEPEIQYQNNTEPVEAFNIDTMIAKTQNKLVLTELNNVRKLVLPSLSLMTSYGTNGFGYNEKPKEFLKFFPVTFIALQLSLPLFNGTVTYQKLEQKELELQNSSLQIALNDEQSAMQIENARQQKVLAQKLVSSTLSQIKVAQTIFEQTEIQQKQGTASLTDLLLADNSLREAQQNYLAIVIDYFKADLEIKKLSSSISNKRIN